MTARQATLAISTPRVDRVSLSSRLAGLAQTVLSLTALLIFTGAVVGLGWLMVHDLLRWAGYIEHVSGAPPSPKVVFVLASINLGVWLTILRVLFHRSDLPSGVAVTQENGSSLWAAVRSMTAEAGIREPDHIILQPDMNAFAAEVPTHGLFRRKERVLGVGYPLLSVLSFPQACAVITHELKHLDAHHSNSALWHGMVAELVDYFSPDRYGGFFWRWICLPADGYRSLYEKLGAHASRLHEFEADHLAGELCGNQNSADALIALETLGKEFEAAVMKPLRAAWERGDAVPDSILGAVDAGIRSSACRVTLQKRLDHALKETTGRYDSHPSLTERIDMLGARARLPSFTNEVSAAQELLLRDDEALRGEVDRFMHTEFDTGFAERRKTVGEVEALLEQVYAPVRDGKASREQAEVVSLLMERSLSTSQTLERHETIVAKYGDIPSSTCELATHRLEAKDLGGAEDLLRIFETHPLMSGGAKRFLEHIINHPDEWSFDELWLKDWAEDPAVRKRISTAMEVFQEMAALTKKAKESLDIPFEPHGLDDWHIDLIVREIGRIFDVHSIFLARRTITECDVPLFQILIVANHLETTEAVKVGGLCCLPGTLKSYVTDAKSIGVTDSSSLLSSALRRTVAVTGKAYSADQAWGKALRNYQPALIFGSSALRVSDKRAPKKHSPAAETAMPPDRAIAAAIGRPGERTRPRPALQGSAAIP